MADETLPPEAESSTPKRVVGRPFQKGQSGNPGGRPKGIAQLREKLEEMEEDCHKVLKAALKDPDPRVGLKALEIAFGYLYGKPSQSVEMSGPEGSPVSIQINRTVKK